MVWGGRWWSLMSEDRYSRHPCSPQVGNCVQSFVLELILCWLPFPERCLWGKNKFISLNNIDICRPFQSSCMAICIYLWLTSFTVKASKGTGLNIVSFYRLIERCLYFISALCEFRPKRSAMQKRCVITIIVIIIISLESPCRHCWIYDRAGLATYRRLCSNCYSNVSVH